jgi:Ca2+-binding EF-hand superfamily protein
MKIHLMMTSLDENNNGEIDFAEFVNWGAQPEAVVLSNVEQ